MVHSPEKKPGSHERLIEGDHLDLYQSSDTGDVHERLRELEVTCEALRRELRETSQARRELNRLNRQLSLLIEQQPVIPYACRAEGDFGATYVSPSVLDITGYRAEELTSDASFWAEHIHPDDRERVFHDLGKGLEHGHHTHEYRWRIADGTYRWFYDCLQLVRDASGAPEYLIGAWLDITERKRAEQAQLEQKAFLQALIDTIPDSVFAVDQNACFTLVNRAFCELLQVSEDQVLGKTAQDALMPGRGRAYHEMVLAVLRTGSPHRSNERVDTDRGDGILVETLLVPYRAHDSGMLGVIGVGRDVTQHERTAEALREATRRAELASHTKSRFLATMSHEIRTPLNSILGYSQLLGRRAEDTAFPAQVREYVEHINTSGHSLSEIINNILELAKIEEGKVAVSNEPIRLALLVKRVHDGFKLQALEKNIELTYAIDGALPGTIHADDTKLTQILNNLLSNAIKFTPAGKRIELRAHRRGDRLLFAVVDQGIGIPEDRQAIVFQPFEQADGSIGRRYGGTGLGLAICRQLCELMGARIWLESTPGQGTTFYVEMALVSGEQESPAEAVGAEPRFAPDSRLLLVEDNPMNQMVARALFAELGLHVHVAGDGQSGVAMAVALEPECIFMDLHMPGMDGLEATRQLRRLARFADVPIIALSADAFTEQRDAALQSGITDYLTKPLMLDTLADKLRKYLRARPAASGPAVERLDRAGLASYPTALLGELVDMFVSLAPESLAKVQRHASAREGAALLEEAHTLKNYGMSVYATALTALCAELELEARHGAWPQIDELVPRIQRECHESMRALAALVGRAL